MQPDAVFRAVSGSFLLDALVVIEIDELIYQESGFLECFERMTVNAFRFENREKI